MRGFFVILKVLNYPLIFDLKSIVMGLMITGIGLAAVLLLRSLEKRGLALKVGLLFVMLGSYVYAFGALRVLMFRALRLVALYMTNPARAGISFYHTLLFIYHYPEIWAVLAGVAGSVYMMSKRERQKGITAPAWLSDMAKDLALKMNVKEPRVMLVDSEVPFLRTNGDPENPIVDVSVGALNLFDFDELRAAVAHELGHVKNADRDVLSLATGASVSTLFSIFGIIIGMIIRRDQEYLADDEAARAVGAKPLIKAIYKAAAASAPSHGLGFIGGIIYPSPYRRVSRLYEFYVHAGGKPRHLWLDEVIKGKQSL